MSKIEYKTIDQIITNKFNIGDYVMTKIGPGYIWSIDSGIFATSNGLIQNREPIYSVHFPDCKEPDPEKIKKGKKPCVWMDAAFNVSHRYKQSELTKIEY